MNGVTQRRIDDGRDGAQFDVAGSRGLFGELRRLPAVLRQASAALVWTAWVLLLLSVPTLLLVALDPRQLLGISVWIKPWKFQVSTGTYLLTLAWGMFWLTPRQRQSWGGRYVTWVAIAGATFEVAYISWQAAWGRASHFNVATPLDATMYVLMGVAAVLLTSTALVLGVMLLRHRPADLSRRMQQAVGWGLVMTFVLGTAFGAYLSSHTGHAVGGSGSDAGGLLLAGWSRSGGDLRVAHFFGIHAVHAMLLFAWVADRMSRGGVATVDRGIGTAHASAVPVWVFAAIYSVFCVWTLVQAIVGRPFLH